MGLEFQPMLYTEAELKQFHRHITAFLANAPDVQKTKMPLDDPNHNFAFFMWQLAREEMRTKIISLVEPHDATGSLVQDIEGIV